MNKILSLKKILKNVSENLKWINFYKILEIWRIQNFQEIEKQMLADIIEINLK